VGRDWPIDYETLEPFYCDAEELLGVAGPSDDTPFVRSRPYPLPPHRLSRPDRAFKEAYPKHFFAQPCARPTRGLSGRAPACCNAAVCTICPIDSKFTVLNGMKHVYRDPRVELRTGATALRVEVGNKVATGVVFREGERVETARSELVVLGANGIFNPFLLLKSGLDGPQTGKGLVEQTSSTYLLQLNGMDSFQGSTSLTGHGYSLYDGEHRARYAGGLIETSNRPEVRPERGKWLQFLRVKVIFEDLREDRNHVTVSEEDPEKPAAVYRGLSEYAKRGMEAAGQKMVKFVSALPVERMNRMSYRGETEAHMLGTTVMGDRENESVVDRKSVHHRVRNLVVLGGSTFPTAAPANPTLTICALALYSAEGLYG
jgi:choline dehydrogenase-like flavoprotein